MQNWSQVWQLRYEQRIHECEEFLRAYDLQLVSAKPQDNFEKRLLEVSLLRFKGKLDDSSQLLDQIESLATHADQFKRFQLQKAFNFFIVGDYVQASIFFKKVLSYKSDDYENYLAQLNLIFCMDNLGFDTSIQLESLQNLYRKKSKHLPPLHDQILNLNIRNTFKKDLNLNEVFKAKSEKPAQSIYQKLWITSLPYMKNRLENFCFDQEYLKLLDVDLLFKDYRIATLLGKKSLPEGEIKISDIIDRLYLWTWYWLHERLSLSLLEETIVAINKHPKISMLTAEDSLLLQNSLGWIELFSCRLDLFRQLPIPLQKEQYAAPLFEDEWRLIQKLRSAKKIGADELESKFLTDQLKSRIKTYFMTSNRAHGSQIVVHLKTGKIVSKNVSYCIEVAHFMHLTQNLGSVSFADVLFYCFGISDYDPSIHYSKISNLVQKLKKNYSNIYKKIFINNGFVHFSLIKEDLRFSFILSNEVSLQKIIGTPNKVSLLNFGNKTENSLLGYFHKFPNKKFNQLDLSIAINKSKATVLRAIKKELEKGSIQKIGLGKNTFYSLRNQT